MLTLHEVTVPQDRTLTWHSVMVTAYRERAQIDTLPFGFAWLDWLCITAQEEN
jgi:hypothetical protein